MTDLIRRFIVVIRPVWFPANHFNGNCDKKLTRDTLKRCHKVGFFSNTQSFLYEWDQSKQKVVFGDYWSENNVSVV